MRPMSHRLRFAVTALAAVAIGTACSAATTNNPGTGATPASGASAGHGIPLSKSCTGDCVAALQLQADPKSINCKVGLSWSTTSFSYGADTLTNTKSFFAQYLPKMTLYEVEGRNDAATQSGQIDELVGRGIKVLIVSPVNASAIGPAVDRAIKAGIKVIASDRNVLSQGVSTYIGADNVDTGVTAGKYAVQVLNGKGNVIEISGSLGASPTIDRSKGFRDAIAGSPNVKIIASQTGNYDQATALKVMQDFLQKYPKGSFDLLYAHGDQMALGAIQAIKEANRQSEIKVVGVDDSGPALAAIQAGDYAGAAAYPLTYQQHSVAAAKLCAGESVPSRIKMESALVTKENAAQFLPGW